MNEWDNEPYEKGFVYRGMECRIKRHPEMKHLCGYCEVPEDHKWHELGYDDILCNVHGGLTYKEPDENGKEFIGFDCAHAGDLIPQMAELREQHDSIRRTVELMDVPQDMKDKVVAGLLSIRMNEVYRNMDFVEAQIKSMVDQLYDAW